MLCRTLAIASLVVPLSALSGGCAKDGQVGRCTGSFGRVCHDLTGEISANSRAFAATLCSAAYLNTAVFEADEACDPAGQTGTCITDVVDAGSGDVILTVESHFYDSSLTCAADVPF